MNWNALFAVVLAAILVWLAIRLVRHHPDAFSKVNLGKSFYTIGLLTLLIVIVVAFCVLLLKG